MNGRSYDISDSFCRQADILRPRLLSYARKFTRSLPEAEDAVQVAILRAYARRATIAPSGLHAYLCVTIRNGFVNTARGARGRREVPLSDVVEVLSSAPPDIQILNAMEQEQVVSRIVERALNLEGVCIDLIYLHVIEEVPLDEIAQQQGIPPGTVRSRLYRSLTRIRDRMGGAATAPSAPPHSKPG